MLFINIYFCNFSFNVVFMFDDDFFNEFNNKGGKSADNYVDQIIALVKNAFKDKTLKNAIGTTINVKSFKTKYNGTIESYE